MSHQFLSDSFSSVFRLYEEIVYSHHASQFRGRSVNCKSNAHDPLLVPGDQEQARRFAAHLLVDSPRYSLFDWRCSFRCMVFRDEFLDLFPVGETRPVYGYDAGPLYEKSMGHSGEKVNGL